MRPRAGLTARTMEVNKAILYVKGALRAAEATDANKFYLQMDEGGSEESMNRVYKRR